MALKYVRVFQTRCFNEWNLKCTKKYPNCVAKVQLGLPTPGLNHNQWPEQLPATPSMLLFSFTLRKFLSFFVNIASYFVLEHELDWLMNYLDNCAVRREELSLVRITEGELHSARTKLPRRPHGVLKMVHSWWPKWAILGDPIRSQ